MALVNPESKLGDVVINDPSVITVINRFNITLGVGDKKIKEICREKNIDIDFFLIILNTFINEEYFPEKVLKSFSVSLIISYLTKTNGSYQRFLVPNIERHFDSLIIRSNSSNNNLELMRQFFSEVKTQILARIENDTIELFPKIGVFENSITKSFNTVDYAKLIDNVNEVDPIEEKLSDLINMFVLHLNGEYDINLCHAVLFAIISFEKDIKQNNRIRNRILKPISIIMEQVSNKPNN